MELQPLKVTTRAELGKGGARQTRRSGHVPGVLYGLSAEPVCLKVDARDFEHLLDSGQGEHALIQLEFEDRPDLSGPAMLKEVQHHPVQGQVTHTDLLRVDLSKKIHTFVAIRFEGHARGVIEGGVIDYQTREVQIACLPMEVPEAIAVDVEALDIGDSLHVRDLAIPENIELLTSGDRAMAAVHAPRVIVEVEEELEEEALVEGEEGAEAADAEEGGEEEESEGERKPAGK